MTDGEIDALREETRGMFYHGLDNYYQHAYPEDELKPLSCQPLTRDRDNPGHIELNDALGNYSLSLVDSLSTLAILASSPSSPYDKHNALRDFQEAVITLIAEYGDGTEGPQGQGRRARGFDLDSKVQVFETVIRGVGGLLSAHLFAIGELPIRGYNAAAGRRKRSTDIAWPVKDSHGKKFVYDGQLLRLAVDLAQRILPSFTTPTGMPYPRVNLRHGVSFYKDQARTASSSDQCPPPDEAVPPRERTETCSAGAGSLILEFATLSHLTGNPIYVELATKAFHAVWDRRSALNLVGSGIDSETGIWVTPVTGVGAGIDSFFEYALKSHVLLSGMSGPNNKTLSDQFLRIWQDAHAAIKRHIWRGSQYQHPHYAQNDKDTGGLRMTWIDSLSAYYPGLLTLGGELEEAATAHLLYAALWTRYGALPERWNAMTGEIEAGLRWWGGRPEFIESTWYLYRATQDPWYLRVGEMVLRDIKQRCYTPCGWAGLQDVATGEQSDRMESFFLGETVKYLYLLFDRNHPLNKLDANFVLTTEGHPLILPRSTTNARSRIFATRTQDKPVEQLQRDRSNALRCPLPPVADNFTGSAVASRPDLFHAAVLSRLISKSGRAKRHFHSQSSTESEGSSLPNANVITPANHTFFPWTVPNGMIPAQGFSSRMNTPRTFELTFPMAQNSPLELGALQRVDGGILINSINGLRFGLVLDKNHGGGSASAYRIHSLSNLALGRDENIWLGSEVVNRIQPLDPQLSRIKDLEMIDLFVDAPAASTHDQSDESVRESSAEFDRPRLVDQLGSSLSSMGADSVGLQETLQQLVADLSKQSTNIESLLVGVDGDTKNLENELAQAKELVMSRQQTTPPITLTRYSFPAAVAAGPGAAPIPQDLETTQTLQLASDHQTSRLPYKKIYIFDSELCSVNLPLPIAKTYQILIIRRGTCKFDDKLRRIPSFAPTATSLKLVVVVSFPEHDSTPDGAEGSKIGSGQEDLSAEAVRPHLEQVQLTPSGVERRHPIPVVMVGGGRGTWEVLLRTAFGVGREADGRVVDDESGREKNDKGHVAGTGPGGVGAKRRYWFESEGIRVANLLVH